MRQQRQLLHLSLLFSLVFFVPGALADMYVDRSIVVFEPGGQPREDVKVSNTDKENIYVQVEVLEVHNPGQADEERVKVTDPKQLKLIVTPTKLVIPPNSQKLVRIVNLQSKNDKERVYRINVTPIVAPLQEEASQLRIVVAYQILTIIQPDKPEAELSAVRSGQSITITNQGNSNALLSEGSQCDPSDSKNCKELTSKRLYAGNSWTMDLPFDAPVSYSVRSFDGIKKQVFK